MESFKGEPRAVARQLVEQQLVSAVKVREELISVCEELPRELTEAIDAFTRALEVEAAGADLREVAAEAKRGLDAWISFAQRAKEVVDEVIAGRGRS